MMKRFLPALAMLLPALAAAATDYVPVATPVTDGVYAIVGPTGPRTYENHGLNNNQGFVVTDAGVVLVDSGASAEGAALIAAAVRKVTDQPIRWVINTGSQDHRWLGNDYFRRHGARIIALARTVDTQQHVTQEHLDRLRRVLRDRLAGTRPAYADKPAAGDRLDLAPGGVAMQLRWLGDAHFPGDAVLWLPEKRVLFSGDLIYVDRLLGVMPHSKVASWRQAFHRAEALQPEYIVPGHGQVCDLARAQRDTGAYLDWLVPAVQAAAAEWEPLESVVARLGEAPQFAYLKNYESLHRGNVNRSYLQFEGQ